MSSSLKDQQQAGGGRESALTTPAKAEAAAAAAALLRKYGPAIALDAMYAAITHAMLNWPRADGTPPPAPQPAPPINIAGWRDSGLGYQPSETSRVIRRK